MALATYCIRVIATGKYLGTHTWDPVAAPLWTPPAGCANDLATPAILAQVAVDLAAAAAADLSAGQSALRDEARSFLLNDPRPEMKAERALALVVLDEVNLLREWIMAFKAATAAATSLTNLQTRVAALSDMPDRTTPQLLNAVVGHITDGSAD